MPYELYEKHAIRKYGAHGTSHRYIAERAAAFMDEPLEDLKLITCHLGNGCSISAIDHGVAVDTSMGLTPLDGLMMGTRCGAIDPAIVPFIMEKENLTAAEVNDLMNKKSGLLGISGISNDLRSVRQAPRRATSAPSSPTTCTRTPRRNTSASTSPSWAASMHRAHGRRGRELRQDAPHDLRGSAAARHQDRPGYGQQDQRTHPEHLHLAPAGHAYMEDLNEAGGIYAVLNELTKNNLLHTDVMTVTGKTMAENIKGCINKNTDIIRPIDQPYSETGGIAVLKGNLAPDRCVVKRSAVAKEMLVHKGPAKVFNSEEEGTLGCFVHTLTVKITAHFFHLI